MLSTLAAEGGTNLIELNLKQFQVAKETLMKRGGLQASAREPGAQGELTLTEVAGSGADADAFRQGGENFRDAIGGRFQAIQDCA